MVTRVGGHFVMYINNESLYCTPETNIVVLYISYTSVKKRWIASARLVFHQLQSFKYYLLFAYSKGNTCSIDCLFNTFS